MPPKQFKKKDQPTANAAKVAKSQPNPKRGGDQKVTPAWWSITTASHEFADAACELKDNLEEEYGDHVSITHFEKAVGEIASLSTEQKALVHLRTKTVDLLATYRAAKEARDAERREFIATRSASAIPVNLQDLRDLAIADYGDDEQEE